MADLYGTSTDRSFSSSSSFESEDMSSFLQGFLNNPSNKGKYGELLPSPSPVSADFLDSDQRFSDLNSFSSTEVNQQNFPPQNDAAGFDFGCQVQKLSEGRQNSNAPRSSKRTRAAEIHNLSEKRRRSRINEKLKALQTLVPNSSKTDKASMLDEAIEYLKQLQLKVQALTMANGFGLQPIYTPQEEEMQRGMGMGYNEGYKFPNPSAGYSGFPFDNQIGMVKADTVFGSEAANASQVYNHSKGVSPGMSS